MFLRTRLAIPAALLAIALGGCTTPEQGGATSTPPTLPAFTTTTTSPTSGAPAAAVDYASLLLTANDISDEEDTFVERSRQPQPNGAGAFFVNDKDNRAISDKFTVYPDAGAAEAALRDATQSLGTSVSGQPRPLPVGSNGVIAVGYDADENKAVTLVYYVEGTALVRLEFQSAPDDATTDKFVTNIAKMQQIALRTGLNDPE